MRRFLSFLLATGVFAVGSGLSAPAYAAEGPIGGFMSGKVNVQESTFDGSCDPVNETDQDSAIIDAPPNQFTISNGAGDTGDGEHARSHAVATSARTGGLLTDVVVRTNVTASAQDHLGSNDPETPDFEGSHCNHFARAEATGEVTFSIATARRVKLTVTGDHGTISLSGGTLAGVVHADNNDLGEDDDILNNVVRTLGVGDYTMAYETYPAEAKAGWSAPFETGGGEEKDLYANFKLHFWKPGQATGPAVGTGVQYVSYPIARNCSIHGVRVGFLLTSEIASVTVTAATRTKTVALPTSDTHITLKGLPDAAAIAVNVTINLKSGDVLEATRPYARC